MALKQTEDFRREAVRTATSWPMPSIENVQATSVISGHRGWLYTAVVIDLFSGQVICWATSDRMKKDLAIRALDMTMRLRNSPSGCIFHSNRDSQYCPNAFQKKLTEHKITSPMSGKKNC